MNETKQDPESPGIDYRSETVLALARDPDAFRARFSNDLPDATSGVLATQMLTDVETLRLLVNLGSFVSGPNWVSAGPATAPASPAGIQALSRVRRVGRDFVRRSANLLAAPGSPVAGFLDGVTRSESSRIIDGLANVSRSTGGGVRLELRLDPRLSNDLPRGPKPTPLLSQPLEGRTFDGDKIEEWREATNACCEGTIEFLDRIGVSHEVEYDGCKPEGEPGSITWCEDFELTPKVVRLLDAAGYGDSTREHFECDEGGDWESLSELEPSAIVERVEPFPVVPDDPRIVEQAGRKVVEEQTKEQTASYDTSKWEFTPEFNLLDFKGSEPYHLASVLPAVVRMTDACEKRGILPAVPGTLSCRGYSLPGSEWQWDPDAGRLTHRVTSAFSVTWDVAEGVMRAHEGGRVTELDDKRQFSVSVRDLGDEPSLWFRVAQGELSI